MPPRTKAKKVSSKSQTTRTSTNPSNLKARKDSIENSTLASAAPGSKRPGLRSGLRSKPSTVSDPPFEDNPESLLRRLRNSRKSGGTKQTKDRQESSSSWCPDIPSNNTKSPLADKYWRVDHEDSAEDIPLLLQETDPEQIFYREWGYLPPLDEEAIAVIEAIIADPEMAKRYTRIGPDHANFPEGLRNRNVLLEESQYIDQQLDCINLLALGEFDETDGEKESHGQLWALDQAKCNRGSNEALFQRTLMMSLISRHLLIYARDLTSQCLLDFSVEESWSCPPMPTRAYWKGESFLTQPKPDLAVCFDRKALIPDHIWNDMPRATKRLACYESADEIGGARVFHFFTIEAKKAKTSTGDTVGMRQSLNNASQALHNMFEFFKEAGQEQENKFFDKVRFFSVVASTEGLAIRIHRATRETSNGPDQGFITPEYPLRFEYREFCSIPRGKFERKTVIETFGKILLGYGANELHRLLHNAAKDIVKKLKEDSNAMFLRGDENFYRYGQTDVPPSRRTPAASQTPSVRSKMSFGSLPSIRHIETLSQAGFSIDMSRSGTTTPRQGLGQISPQVLDNTGKRRRENGMPARRTRQKRQ